MDVSELNSDNVFEDIAPFDTESFGKGLLVEQSAYEIRVSWLGESRPDTEH